MKQYQTFGKFTLPDEYHKIENEQDVVDKRNAMAQGNYPLSMTDCEVIGIGGNCGPDCIVLLRGECEHEQI